MNYRHAYHAGNFADVMKHLALVPIVEHLKKKDAPFCVIDAHGGTGLYDLGGVEAAKTGEWRDGIGRFDASTGQEDFDAYYRLIENDLSGGHYPGSPALIARMLRAGDRLIANELHPEDVATLPDMVQYGDLRPMNEWLKKNIHSKGRSVGALELISRVTGEQLTAEPLLRHLERRYLSDKR